VLQEFLNTYDFVGVTIDYALRQFLSAFVLPVESQQIDRIMEKFSNRYHVTNPTMFQHAGTNKKKEKQKNIYIYFSFRHGLCALVCNHHAKYRPSQPFC